MKGCIIGSVGPIIEYLLREPYRGQKRRRNLETLKLRLSGEMGFLPNLRQMPENR